MVMLVSMITVVMMVSVVMVITSTLFSYISFIA